MQQINWSATYKKARVLPVAIWLVSATLGVIAPVVHAENVRPLKAVRLIQESSVDGKFELLVSPVGLRIKNFKGAYELYCAAPDWEVIAVRPEAREFAKLPLAKWRKFAMPSFRMMGEAAGLTKPSKTFQSVDSEGKKISYEFAGSGKEQHGYSGWIDAAAVLGYELISRDFGSPPEVSAVVYRYYNLPILSGLPTQLLSRIREGKIVKRGWLVRTDSSKTETIAGAKIFHPVLKNFKDAGAINTQFLTRGISGLADEMSDMIDVKRK